MLKVLLAFYIILMAIMFPIGVIGADYSAVGITATGNDPGVLPAAPTNFIGVLIGTDNVDLTWTMGVGATSTVIVRRLDTFPTTPVDGVVVYNGTDDNCTDVVSLTDSTECYYSAWSINGIGYSVDYATLSIGGEVMAASLGLLAICGFMGLGFFLNFIFAWKNKVWWVCPIAFFLWVGISYICYLESAATTVGDTTMDFYRILTWVCGLCALASLGELLVIYRETRKEIKEEDDMATRTRRLVDKNLKSTFRHPDYTKRSGYKEEDL